MPPQSHYEWETQTFSLSPEFSDWGRVSEKNMSDAMDADKDYIDSKFVEINTIFFARYNKTIYITYAKYYIIV